MGTCTDFIFPFSCSLVWDGTFNKEKIVAYPKIFLLRHGQTVWNAEGRYQGQLDSPLTEKGKEQAKNNALKLKQHLSSFSNIKIFSSPLGRAKSTTLILCNVLDIDVKNLRFEDAIKEVNYGLFEGKTKAYCKEVYSEAYEARENDKWSYCLEGGESYKMVDKRLKNWLKTIENEKEVIIVAHEMINRVLRGLYCAYPIEEMLQLRQDNDIILKLENANENFLE
jgi:probable phosphoglycerate mutase